MSRSGTIAKRAKAAAVTNLAVVDAVERTLEDAEDADAVDDARARRARGEKTIPAAEARRRLGPTTPNGKRTRPMVTLTLSPEALARLDAIAAERGQTRSGAVEQLVRNARLRETDSR